MGSAKRVAKALLRFAVSEMTAMGFKGGYSSVVERQFVVLAVASSSLAIRPCGFVESIK
jgi:hypothetical protein